MGPEHPGTDQPPLHRVPCGLLLWADWACSQPGDLEVVSSLMRRVVPPTSKLPSPEKKGQNVVNVLQPKTTENMHVVKQAELITLCSEPHGRTIDRLHKRMLERTGLGLWWKNLRKDIRKQGFARD